MSTRILGVDVGGVIITKSKDQADTAFLRKDYLQTPPVLEAFETLARLANGQFDQVYLISKCDPPVEERTKRWLRHHRFYERTGIPEANVRFCRIRYQKRGLCQALGVTHFIDDKLEVLSYLANDVPSLLLFKPEPQEMSRYPHFLHRVRVVHTWKEVEAML